MPVQSPVEVRGALEPRDLMRYQYYHSQRRLWPITILLVCIYLVALVSTPMMLMDDEWQNNLANLGPFLLMFGLFLYMLLGLPRRAAMKQFKEQPYLAETVEHTFTLTEIVLEAETTSSRIAWSNVREIRETKSLFFLYHGPNIAMVVPKRFFQEEEHIREWRALVATAFPKGISGSGVLGRIL